MLDHELYVLLVAFNYVSHTSETLLIGKMEKERFLGFFYPFVSIISLLSCFARSHLSLVKLATALMGFQIWFMTSGQKENIFTGQVFMIYLLRRMGERKHFPIVRRVVHFRII